MGTKGVGGAQCAECSKRVRSASIEPAEGVEPVEDQNHESGDTVLLAITDGQDPALSVRYGEWR